MCRVTNRAASQILICAKPSCNIWHESHILGVLGIWGITEVEAGLRGTPLRWATACKVLAKRIPSMGVAGTARGLGEAIVKSFSVAPIAAVFLSSGLVEHSNHSGPPRYSVAGLNTFR
eukprot:4149970-Alexandrium_andersonii.AAC.1